MSEEKKPINLNDPRSHSMVATLLDSPDSLGISKHVKDRFCKAVDAALSLPDGDGRIALLRTLSTAISDVRRRQELYAENQVLAAQLKAENPVQADLNEARSRVKAWVQSLHTKFKQCYDAEAKRGTDMWKTSWPWFEHEMHVYLPAIVREVEKAATRVSVELKPDPDANE
jgi:hypothetical protein